MSIRPDEDTYDGGGNAHGGGARTLSHAPPLPFSCPAPTITLRDWFAGQALAGMALMCGFGGAESKMPDSYANDAYRYADAMIARGAKP